jgi:hypothetical protein
LLLSPVLHSVVEVDIPMVVHKEGHILHLDMVPMENLVVDQVVGQVVDQAVGQVVDQVVGQVVGQVVDLVVGQVVDQVEAQVEILEVVQEVDLVVDHVDQVESDENCHWRMEIHDSLCSFFLSDPLTSFEDMDDTNFHQKDWNLLSPFLLVYLNKRLDSFQNEDVYPLGQKWDSQFAEILFCCNFSQVPVWIPLPWIDLASDQPKFPR